MAPNTYGPSILASTVVTLVIATIFVVLRFISRGLILRRLAIDDVFMALAWVFSTGLSILFIYAVSLGFGDHYATIPRSHDAPLMKIAFVFSIIYPIAFACSKLSVLIYYYTTLSRTNAVFRWSTIATIALVSLSTIAEVLLCLLPCRPIANSYVWPRPAGSNCVNSITVYLGFSPTNILSNLLILLLPVPIIIHELRIPRKQKLIIFLTLGFSGFIAILDIARIVLLQVGMASQETRQDYTYNVAPSLLLSLVDVNLSVIAASMVALKPLVVRVFGWDRRSEKSTLYTPDQTQPNPTTKAFNHIEVSSRPSTISLATLSQAHSKLEKTVTSSSVKESSPNSSTTVSQEANGTNYDFVNLGTTKCLTQLTLRQSIKPLLEIGFLYFLWGLQSTFINTLNYTSQSEGYISVEIAGANHALYWCGYLIAPPTVGYWVLTRFGWRCCFIVGLLVLSTGNLIFWPAGLMVSTPGIMVSYLVVGCGIALIEAGANSYCFLLGPPRYAGIRLLYLQVAYGLGPLVASGMSRALTGSGHPENLNGVDLVYLAFCMSAFLLAFWFQITRMPEASNKDLDQAVAIAFPNESETPKPRKLIWIVLALACVAVFCTTGVQEVGATLADASASDGIFGPSFYVFLIVDFAVLVAAAVIAGAATLIVKPRWVLLITCAGLLVFGNLSRRYPSSTKIGTVMYYMARSFQAPIWPLVFAVALPGLGRRTKLFGTVIVTSACGGGVMPLLVYVTSVAKGLENASIMIIVAIAMALLLPIYLNIVPAARWQADGGNMKRPTPDRGEVHLEDAVPKDRERIGFDFLTSALRDPNQGHRTRSSLDFITSAEDSDAPNSRSLKRVVTRQKSMDDDELELNLFEGVHGRLALDEAKW